MADGVSSVAPTPFVRSPSAGGTQKIAPSVLDLGSYYLTRNVRAESLGRVFARPASGDVFSNVESFLAVAAESDLDFSAKDNSAASVNSANAAYAAALNLFAKRETPAEARLRELLEAPAPKPPVEAAAEPTLKIATNTGGTLDEGGTFVLTSEALLASADDAVNNNITYSVTGGPVNGHLERTNDPGGAVISFTQADIATGLIRYVHNNTATTTDSFRFTVRSGTETLEAEFLLSIIPVNDTPELVANTGASVEEGGTTILTTAQLDATDIDTTNANLFYRITAGPGHGRLELTTDPGTAITSFTQSELAAGRVRYVHDGAEASTDSFDFALSDETTALSPATFGITVAPLDDAPQLTNTGAFVAEGNTLTLAPASLSASDPDTADSDLVFTVNAGPSQGFLQLSTDPGISINSFTQADLAAGIVQYVNGGSENAADAFDFSLTDGNTTVNDTFTISVGPADDPPALDTNTGATVDEGGTVFVTTAELNAADTDTPSANLVFTVTSAPVNGHLELVSNPGVAITTFTQEELDAGIVTYVHDGSETTSDSFSFTLADQSTTLAAASFSISINPVDDLPDLVNAGGTTVTEGGSTLITTSQLSATDVDTANENLTYTLTTAPLNGYLELTTNAGIAITSFTQADIEAGIVNYVHDGSESATDSFIFSLSDGTSTFSGNSFEIAVDPVDDAPVQVTNASATVGEGAAVILTTSELNTTDADTAHYNLIYTVTTSPANGYLQYATSPGTAIGSFTQADLEAGIVQYVHDGSETASDSFDFTVSDETTTLGAATFGITVIPSDDAPSVAVNSAATVTEGSAVGLSTSHLSASDVDTSNFNVVYSITSGPANGLLEFVTSPGTAITSFTQADLEAGLVQYIHDGSETSSDSFAFTLSDGTTTLSGNTFNINVTPVDDAPELTANTGTSVSLLTNSTIITTAQLNASDVDTSTSNIIFTVTGGLTRGRLELTTSPGTAVTSFTEADLAANRVRYVHTSFGVADDSFNFTVKDATTTLSSATFSIDVTV